MTTFAVGDRVRFVADSIAIKRGAVGTLVEECTDHGFRARIPNALNKDTEFVAITEIEPEVTPPPPFTKGDKVVAVVDVSALGVRKGVVYTVQTVQSYGADYGTLVCVESASGHRTWSDPSRFKQYEPKPQQVELRYGDKVKNTRTGREGLVWMGPISNILKVYDLRPPYRDGVPAAAVEEYEFHHPGTYELVLRGQGQVF